MLKMQEIIKMKDTELKESLSEKREELRNARFNPTARDTKTVQSAKKTIARILTEMQKRRNQIAN